MKKTFVMVLLGFIFLFGACSAEKPSHPLSRYEKWDTVEWVQIVSAGAGPMGGIVLFVEDHFICLSTAKGTVLIPFDKINYIEIVTHKSKKE